MKVKQAMHEGVQWVDPSMSVKELARLMREHDIGAIPIGENDRLVGMVTDRDIVCRCVAEGMDTKKATARQVMSKGIVFCRDEEELDDAARIMEHKKVRRLPVLNKDKRMIGMLSLGDVSEAGPHDLMGEVMKRVSAHHGPTKKAKKAKKKA
jgi:CBS domain-containing protein